MALSTEKRLSCLRVAGTFTWDVTDTIGRGVNSVVYHARDARGKVCAVKEYKERRIRFNDLERLRNIEHPNLVKMVWFDAKEHPGIYVMEFCDSGSFLDILNQTQYGCGFPDPMFIAFLGDLTAGLEHLRNNKIITRLHPKNIRCCKNNTRVAFKIDVLQQEGTESLQLCWGPMRVKNVPKVFVEYAWAIFSGATGHCSLWDCSDSAKSCELPLSLLKENCLMSTSLKSLTEVLLKKVVGTELFCEASLYDFVHQICKMIPLKIFDRTTATNILVYLNPTDNFGNLLCAVEEQTRRQMYSPVVLWKTLDVLQFVSPEENIESYPPRIRHGQLYLFGTAIKTADDAKDHQNDRRPVRDDQDVMSLQKDMAKFAHYQTVLTCRECRRLHLLHKADHNFWTFFENGLHQTHNGSRSSNHQADLISLFRNMITLLSSTIKLFLYDNSSDLYIRMFEDSSVRDAALFSIRMLFECAKRDTSTKFGKLLHKAEQDRLSTVPFCCKHECKEHLQHLSSKVGELAKLTCDCEDRSDLEEHEINAKKFDMQLLRDSCKNIKCLLLRHQEQFGKANVQSAILILQAILRYIQEEETDHNRTHADMALLGELAEMYGHTDIEVIHSKTSQLENTEALNLTNHSMDAALVNEQVASLSVPDVVVEDAEQTLQAAYECQESTKRRHVLTRSLSHPPESATRRRPERCSISGEYLRVERPLYDKQLRRRSLDISTLLQDHSSKPRRRSFVRSISKEEMPSFSSNSRASENGEMEENLDDELAKEKPDDDEVFAEDDVFEDEPEDVVCLNDETTRG